MKNSLLVAALFALTLIACSKKEEPVAVPVAPAAPAAVQPAPEAPVPVPVAPAGDAEPKK